MEVKTEINNKLSAIFDGVTIRTDLKKYPKRVFFFNGENMLFFIWITLGDVIIGYSSKNTVGPIIKPLGLHEQRIVLEKFREMVIKMINMEYDRFYPTVETIIYEEHFRKI